MRTHVSAYQLGRAKSAHVRNRAAPRLPEVFEGGRENGQSQKALEKDFSNFKFYIALSEPLEEDNWKVKKTINDEGDGFLGFVHQAVIDQYLVHHEAPEDIELYFCGPPLMNQAVLKMAEDWGIPDENVRFDDFGG